MCVIGMRYAGMRYAGMRRVCGMRYAVCGRDALECVSLVCGMRHAACGMVCWYVECLAFTSFSLYKQESPQQNSFFIIMPYKEDSLHSNAGLVELMRLR